MKTPSNVQQFLKQSLRDLVLETEVLSSSQDHELLASLQKLTGRLKDVLSEAGENTTLEPEEQGNPQKNSSHRVSSSPAEPFPNFYIITSADGMILSANESACQLMDLDLARVGGVSLSEFVPDDEWKVIRHFLREGKAIPPSKTWIVTMVIGQGDRQKIHGTITPMFRGGSRSGHWLWEFRYLKGASAIPAPETLTQGLVSQLVAGESVEYCLSRICQELVNTFGLSCVWIAHREENDRLVLCAHSEKSELDWEAHGPGWWNTLNKKNLLGRIPSEVQIIPVLSSRTKASPLQWMPVDFGHLTYAVIPLLEGGQVYGVFVVASEHNSFFDETVCSWLRLLGSQIADLINCGKQLTPMHLQSAAMKSASYAVCVTDSQGRLQWVNEAYTGLLGVTIQTILGTHLHSFPRKQIEALMKAEGYNGVSLASVKTEVQEKLPTGQLVTLEQIVTPVINDRGAITHYVAILQDITGRKTAEAHIKHLAYHDTLTDLPNRFMFEDRLQQALAQTRRQGGYLAVLFMDLDNFKVINDQFGHRTGDRLLRVVAKRLVGSLRATDTVARLSGDEFTMILTGLDRIRDIRQVIQKVFDGLTPPIRLNGQDITVKVSIGVAVYPKDATNSNKLLEIADRAMYQAKKEGGQRWVFATQEWNFE